MDDQPRFTPRTSGQLQACCLCGRRFVQLDGIDLCDVCFIGDLRKRYASTLGRSGWPPRATWFWSGYFVGAVWAALVTVAIRQFW